MIAAKVSLAVLVLFSNVGLGELGSHSLLPVVGWTYRFGSLFWLCSSFIGISELSGLRFGVFFCLAKGSDQAGNR